MSGSLLFAPVRLGPLTVPNRLVKSAMAENLCDGQGGPTDRMLRLYEAWARGGTGLLITGNAAVLPGQGFSTLNLEFGRASVRERMTLLTERVHRHGARILAQLYHPGSQIPSARCSALAPVSSSRRMSLVNFHRSRALSSQEIRDLIASFGEAAAQAKACGFDGVQVHAAHGYLHTQFLSPRYNRRKDDWGGTPGKRRRLLIECVRAVRDRTGSDFLVLVKLNGTDGTRDGVSLEESAETGAALEQSGCDAIEVSGGCGEVALGFYAEKGEFPADLARQAAVAQDGFTRWVAPLASLVRRHIEKQIQFTPCYFLREAQAIKRAVTIPVIAVGGFRKRSEMEEAVAAGKADLISLARPLIREPGLPQRLMKSTDAEATCTSCNRCYVSAGLDLPLRCYRFI